MHAVKEIRNKLTQEFSSQVGSRLRNALGTFWFWAHQNVRRNIYDN